VVNEGDALTPEGTAVDATTAGEADGVAAVSLPWPRPVGSSGRVESEMDRAEAPSTSNTERARAGVLLVPLVPERDAEDSAGNGEELASGLEDAAREVEGHLEVLRSRPASQQQRDAAVEAVLTALSGGYEPELRLEMVKALVNHAEDSYYSLLAEHIRDIRSEAEAFQKEELATAAQKLLERLETPDK
jgi:hypothetical protein